MAQENLSAIATALATTAAPEIVRTWNRTAVTVQELTITQSAGQGGGKQVAWNVESSGASAASFAEGSDVASGEFATDPVTMAVLPWGQYRSAFNLTNLELIAAAANTGNAEELADMFSERFLGSITKILSTINKDIISGTGTDGNGNPTIIGLDTALASTGTYAGINKGTITEWQGNVNANGGTARPLTLNLLAASEALVYTASNVEGNLLIGSVGVHTKYEGLFEATRRTVDSGQGPIPSYNGSTGRLYWRGKPVIRDKDFTTGELMILDQGGIELCFLGNMEKAFPDKIAGRGVMAISSNGSNKQEVKIPFYMYPLARTGSAVKMCVEIYCQLKVRRPNSHCKIADISEV